MIEDALAPGSSFGDFTVEELIGEGGMGLVYRAMQGGLDRRVALKIIAPHLAEQEAFRERFKREARRAAAVDHPAIVPIYGAGEIEGRPYLAMRFIPGTDLGSLLAHEGPITPPQRALAIIEQIAGALDAAHADGLIHRDVKPANILIESVPGGRERAYLTDFGLTRGNSDTSLTRTGTFMGSPQYMSPEQIQGGDLDARADQYSLACVLYEALTGSPPFQTEGQLQAIYAHLHTDPPRLSESLPDLPPAVDIVLSRGLSKTASDRFGSCQEFVTELRRAAALPVDGAPGARARANPAVVQTVPVGSLALSAGARSPRRRRLLQGGGAIIVAAVVAVVVVVIATSGSTSKHPAVAGGHLTNTATTTSSTGSATTAAGGFPPSKSQGVLDLAYQATQGALGYRVQNGSQSGTMDITFTSTLMLVHYTKPSGESYAWNVNTGSGIVIWFCRLSAGAWSCQHGSKLSGSVNAMIDDYDDSSASLPFTANLNQEFGKLVAGPHAPPVTTAEQAGQKVACFSGSVDGGRRAMCVTADGLVSSLLLKPQTGAAVSVTATKLSPVLPKKPFTIPGPYA